MKNVTKLITRTEKYELGNRLSSRVIKVDHQTVSIESFNQVHQPR